MDLSRPGIEPPGGAGADLVVAAKRIRALFPTVFGAIRSAQGVTPTRTFP